jgi:hypothetical protein
MFTRPLGMSVVDNPLIDSPYFLQFDIGFAITPPVVEPYFLLSTGDAFLLSTNDKLLLSG